MHAFTIWFTHLNYIQVYGLAVAMLLVGIVSPVVGAAIVIQRRSQQDD